MSFTGDLEHLPIVDIIQLLHATRKSGTLSVRSLKGESQLVFKDGYIVSANHLNNSVRIGQILIKMDALTPGQLQNALQDQMAAGNGRKPLIATLIETGVIDKEIAFKGLENLIEMTVVEILTWDGGTFGLSVDTVEVSDEYRYFPDKLHQEINLDTQSVLMDALRIYDEKKRDGHLDEATFEESDVFPDLTEPVAAEVVDEDLALTLADLGLDVLDDLPTPVIDVFKSLDDHDPAAEYHQQLNQLRPDLSSENREPLVASFLRIAERHPAAETGSGKAQGQAVLTLSGDPLLSYVLSTLCQAQGLHGFTTNEGSDLDPIIDQYLSKDIEPIMLIDQRDSGTILAMAELTTRLKGKYPALTIIQLATGSSFELSTEAYRNAIRAVIPTPSAKAVQDDPGTHLPPFLEMLQAYLGRCFCQQNRSNLQRVSQFISSSRDLHDAPDVAHALMELVGEFCSRSITFIIRKDDLVSERGIGFDDAARSQATPIRVQLPLNKSSLLQQVIKSERPYFGACDDSALAGPLFATIGEPANRTILLLPMKSHGRVITITYGDFGSGGMAPIPLDLLEILSGQAGLILENAFYRKQLQK